MPSKWLPGESSLKAVILTIRSDYRPISLVPLRSLSSMTRMLVVLVASRNGNLYKEHQPTIDNKRAIVRRGIILNLVKRRRRGRIYILINSMAEDSLRENSWLVQLAREANTFGDHK